MQLFELTSFMIDRAREGKQAGPHDLALGSAAFPGSLHGAITSALANLIRSMICCFSKGIESHNAHPVDMEKGLDGYCSAGPQKRDLQMEADAHISGEKRIDQKGFAEPPLLAAEIRQFSWEFIGVSSNFRLNVP